MTLIIYKFTSFISNPFAEYEHLNLKPNLSLKYNKSLVWCRKGLNAYMYRGRLPRLDRLLNRNTALLKPLCTHDNEFIIHY